MQVNITIAGPQGAGKTVLAGFIADQLTRRFGMTCIVKIGQGAPFTDSVEVHTNTDTLAQVAASTNR